MADTPVTPTPVGSWPTAPQRTDAPATFVTRADAWVAATPTRSTEMNALATNVNFNATSAFESAGEALASSTASVAAANFQGAWSSLTGAFTVGHSVKHDGLIWIANTAIADVASAEPGVSGDWDQVGGTIREARTANIQLSPVDYGKIIDYTSGTFSQTFDSAVTLGEGWAITLTNTGTGVITLDPDGSETINGASTVTMQPNETGIVTCNGTALFYVKLNEEAGDHRIVVHTGNGYGSTDTAIRRYTTKSLDVGTAITHATSVANGDTFTINLDGTYQMTTVETDSSGASFFGVSVNSSELTTGILVIADADRIGLANRALGTSGNYATYTVAAFLSAGDVVRPHGDGLADGAGIGTSNFYIVRISS